MYKKWTKWSAGFFSLILLNIAAHVVSPGQEAGSLSDELKSNNHYSYNSKSDSQYLLSAPELVCFQLKNEHQTPSFLSDWIWDNKLSFIITKGKTSHFIATFHYIKEKYLLLLYPFHSLW